MKYIAVGTEGHSNIAVGTEGQTAGNMNQHRLTISIGQEYRGSLFSHFVPNPRLVSQQTNIAVGTEGHSNIAVGTEGQTAGNSEPTHA